MRVWKNTYGIDVGNGQHNCCIWHLKRYRCVYASICTYVLCDSCVDSSYTWKMAVVNGQFNVQIYSMLVKCCRKIIMNYIRDNSRLGMLLGGPLFAYPTNIFFCSVGLPAASRSIVEAKIAVYLYPAVRQWASGSNEGA